MKKYYFTLLLIGVLYSTPIAQSFNHSIIKHTLKAGNDTLLRVLAKPQKGFHYEYLLYLPKKVIPNKKVNLLVEPNNTGRVHDDIKVHYRFAFSQACISSIGNLVARHLNIPLLVPIFPRPRSNWRMYTHALDKETIWSKEKTTQRIDLQLLAMIKDAQQVLKNWDIQTHDQFLLNGFSASGTFTNRFVFLHPQQIRAAAMGGVNGILMLPLDKLKGKQLPFPLGIADFKQITGYNFNMKEYQKVPQMIYMGQHDKNDAVKYDDAYNDDERQIIHKTMGKTMQPDRWEACQNIYRKAKVNAQLITYAHMGHGTDTKINNAIIQFFKRHLQIE